MRSSICILVFLLTNILSTTAIAQAVSGWKSGVATAIITPETNLWMAGYANRDRPAEGVLQDLKVKALAIQDSSGSMVVFVTSDLLGLPKNLSDAVAANINQRHHLERSQVMLTSSHTHSGPVLDQSLADIYPLNQDQLGKVKVYTKWLETQMTEVVSQAINSLEPSTVLAGSGQVRFAVNRRNNSETAISNLSELKGPIDHSVPILKIQLADGSPQAIVFGYACHATTLNGYEWSGDYPGFDQQYLENEYPGVTAMFFAGCGADQNPLPRRTIPLAQQYGQHLSTAVSRVLKEDMIELNPVLRTAYKEVELPLSDPPAIDSLEMIAESELLYQKQWASRWLKVQQDGGVIPESYPWYPVQTWQLGSLTWVALGGEVVVDYSHKLKALLGSDIYIAAYANDVMAYIPSIRVLEEGGYEGATSMQVYGLPSTWAPSIEELLISEVQRQVESLKIK
jgi:hypothetical protein